MKPGNSKMPVLLKWSNAAGQAFSRTPKLWLFEVAYSAIAVFSGIGLLGKAVLLSNITHIPLSLVYLVIIASLCAPLFWKVALRYRSFLGSSVAVLLLVCFVFVFPRMQSLHAQGRGSDQPDCVIVAAKHLMAGTWPYERSEMWSRNPMSCGPGWVAVQGPAIVTLGYAANLEIIWSVCLCILFVSVGWRTAAALLGLIGLSPAFWLGAANGTDFLSFGIAFAALVSISSRLGFSKLGRIIIGFAASLLGQFRVVSLLLPACFVNEIGQLTACASLALSLSADIAFIYWNTSSFVKDGPLFVIGKLTNYSFSVHPFSVSLEICLPVTVATIAVMLLKNRLRLHHMVLLYLSGIFLIPSILDLFKKKLLYHTYGAMLEYWEGSLWLMAFLPVSALFLVQAWQADQ